MEVANGAAPLAKPEIVSFDELLEDALKGRIVVPRFQRPYVWKPTDIRKLLESVLKGYPIGSFFLWETEENIERTDKIGAIKVSESATSSRRYLLDGHQRLATLLSVLMLPANYPRGHADWKWWVYYDLDSSLDSEPFKHFLPGNDEVDSKYFPVRSLLSTSDFLKEARRIENDEWLNRADMLARAFRDYRIPVTVMRRGSLDQAVEVFSRLNSRGVDLTRDQMASALTYRSGGPNFNLADTIDGIGEKLTTLGFGNTNRKTIFLSIGAAAGIDFQRADLVSSIRHPDKIKTLERASDDAANALESASRFLINVGVITDRLLPYTNQLLLLGHFFGKCKSPNAAQHLLLTKWFWATSLNGWFAGANTTDINNGLIAMANLASDIENGVEEHIKAQPIRQFPRTFDLRSARIRANLLIQLLVAKPRHIAGDLLGNPVDGATIFNNEAFRNLPYVFDRIWNTDSASSPANRIIALRPGNRKTVKKALLELAENGHTEILQSVCVTPPAVDAMRDNQPHLFITARESELSRLEQEFVSRLGLVIRSDIERSYEEVDTE
ncbi:MAG: DUF262 domain-containing protein [Alphaproteobacteria bacterium]|nr:DUF262 domain-containing protein [Alphaproteobacteria bacterium]